MARKEAVIIIAEFGDEVLIVKKVKDGTSLMSDKWHLPGETKIDGETDEEAVHRGLREETKVLVAKPVYLTTSESPKGTLLKWYRCEALTRQLIPGDDVVDAQWADKNNVAYVCDPEAVAMWSQVIREYFRLIN